LWRRAEKGSRDGQNSLPKKQGGKRKHFKVSIEKAKKNRYCAKKDGGIGPCSQDSEREKFGGGVREVGCGA